MYLKWVKYKNGRNFFWFSKKMNFTGTARNVLEKNDDSPYPFDAREVKAVYSFRVLTPKTLCPRFEKEFFYKLTEEPSPDHFINDLQADSFIDKIVGLGILKLISNDLDFYKFIIYLTCRDWFDGTTQRNLNDKNFAVTIAAIFLKEGLTLEDLSITMCIALYERETKKRIHEARTVVDMYPKIAFFLKQTEEYFEEER